MLLESFLVINQQRKSTDNAEKQLYKVTIVLNVVLPPFAGNFSTLAGIFLPLAGRVTQLTIILKLPFGKLKHSFSSSKQYSLV